MKSLIFIARTRQRRNKRARKEFKKPTDGRRGGAFSFFRIFCFTHTQKKDKEGKTKKTNYMRRDKVAQSEKEKGRPE